MVRHNPPASRPIVFLLNPNAGRGGRKLPRIEALVRRSPALRAAAEFDWAETVEQIAGVVRALQPGTVVVAVGGDGTVNLVATALVTSGLSHVALGLFPLGTGNALAHSLGIPTLRRALQVLERGAVRHIDVMRTTHPDMPVAVISVSAGFESAFLTRYARGRRAGRLLGGLAGAVECGRHCDTIALELDGKPVVRRGERVFNVGLYNLVRYPMGVAMFPEGELDDGWGEALVHRAPATYWAATLAGFCRLTPRFRADVLRRRWHSARLTTNSHMQIDGEVVRGGDIGVEVARHALQVLAPATGAATLPLDDARAKPDVFGKDGATDEPRDAGAFVSRFV